jgi:hypothetical protein
LSERDVAQTKVADQALLLELRERGKRFLDRPLDWRKAVRRLEAKLGVRLLNRTTRSVAPTEAGGILVAVLLRAFPLFSEPPPLTRAAACLCGFHQGGLSLHD